MLVLPAPVGAEINKLRLDWKAAGKTFVWMVFRWVVYAKAL